MQLQPRRFIRTMVCVGPESLVVPSFSFETPMSGYNFGMESSADRLESFYAALRNLDKMEHEDFREVIKSQLNPTLRERYLTVNYHRAAFNVEMMLAIKDTKQFQTLSLLARAIFELAVEMKSINVDLKAAQKIELFSRMESLRSARRLVEFKKKHPNEKIS
jgi:hypothetical protein